jgi:salicylate hydroxylase
MPRVVDRFEAAYYHAHRRDLVNSLTSRLDKSRVRLGSQVVAVGQDSDRAWVDCADGTRLEGDVVVGADGIHSMVRESIFRPDSPRPSGYATWRGVIDAASVAHLDIPMSSYVVMGPRLSFVFYYVAAGKELNWLALGQTDDKKGESWSQTANKNEILAAFDGWYDLPKEIITATEAPFVTALYDRTPLTRWVGGRIAVMGDAAHAMLPYHAQGAVQSIEDAWVLGRCLANDGQDANAALMRFEALRLDRTTRMVKHSRNAQGWYHVDDVHDVAARNDRFRSVAKRSEGDFTPQQNWLYAYDAEKAFLGTDDEWRNLPEW